MITDETTTIAICAGSTDLLDSLVLRVREAGEFGIVPVQWPDAPALITARQLAHAYVLGTDGGCEEVIAQLGPLLKGRPRHAPLIVVGAEPARAAAPDLWVPTLPAAALVASMLRQLIGNARDGRAAGRAEGSEDGGADGASGASHPAWRRKSDMIIGNSPPIRRLLHTLDQLAPAPTPVLINGESGVGKELVARALHFCGPRAKDPFIAINCAAIPDNLIEAELFGHERGAFTGAVAARPGAIEAAHNGTLFLDEIGEMPLGMQAKLLRVLETSEVQRIGANEVRKVNFRLVSATNRRLDEEIKHGRFREDLYYRVQVYPIEVPALRERPEDIPLLVTHYLSAIAARDHRPALRLTAAALEKLLTYRWPGNVRELVNLLERAVLVADDRVIQAEHVILADTGGEHAPSMVLPYRDAKARFEHAYYTQLVRIAGGNISLAAKLGQKTRKEIYDALKRLGVDPAAYRG